MTSDANRPPGPAARSFADNRAAIWASLAELLPGARPGPGIGPVVDAAAALETILDVYVARGRAHGTVAGATTDDQTDKLLRLLGPLPSGVESGRAVVAVEVSEPLPALVLKARGSNPVGLYEATSPTSVEPQLNRWSLVPAPVNAPTDREVVRFSPQSFGLREGAVVVFRDPSRTPLEARVVEEITEVVGPDGNSYIDVRFPAAGPESAHRVVQTPSQRAPATSTGAESTTSSGATVTLSTLQPQLQAGSWIVLEMPTDHVLARVEAADTVMVTYSDELEVPVSRLHLTDSITGDVEVVHHTFVDAARLARTAPHSLTEAALSVPVPLAGPVDPPGRIGDSSTLDQMFLLVDADGRGVEVDGSMVFDPEQRTATFRVVPPPRAVTLRMPVTVHGNLVELREGESVDNEVLGSGQPALGPQRFDLKKKPLVHDGPTAEHPERRSSLAVYVDGRRWHQVESFFGHGPSETIFTVEQRADGTASVVFGRPLPAGTDNVVAGYRYGGTGSPAPPGSLVQPVGAPSVVRAIHQPTAGTAGTALAGRAGKVDATRQTALMLDRAVPAADIAARAATRSGVDRAEAVVRWIEGQQRIGVRVIYIGAAEPDDVLADLTSVTEPGLPISAVQAVGLPAELSMTVVGDGTRPQADVVTAVTEALLGAGGLLTRARIPIGHRLPLEHLHAAVVGQPGVVRVQEVTLHYGETTLTGTELATGLTAGDGEFLDFAAPSALTVVVSNPR